MTISLRLGTLLLACAATAMLITPRASAQTDPEQEAHDWRQTYGFYEVVQADALVKDFQAGRITEAAFTAEIWEQYPVLTASAYAQWGTINSCFLMDVVYGQSNGPIAYDSSGQPLFFDVAQYLDSSGHVLPGKARDYNTATRANTILRGLHASWGANSTCMQSPPVTNTCCKCPVLCNCDTPKTGARCATTYGNQNCATGATNCP